MLALTSSCFKRMVGEDICSISEPPHEKTNNLHMRNQRRSSKFAVIALSHIHVSAAYRSRIYENVDTPRSEPYFARETYVPRTCDVPATFPWRIRDVSVFVWNFTFVCTAYQCVCATYV